MQELNTKTLKDAKFNIFGLSFCILNQYQIKIGIAICDI